MKAFTKAWECPFPNDAITGEATLQFHAKRRTAKTAAVAALLFGLTAGRLLSVAADAQQTAGNVPTDKPAALRLPVALTVTTDKKQYRVGDPITMTLTVKNPTKHEVILPYRDSQKYDFEIRKGKKADGPLVWQWAKDMMFMQALLPVSLEAGKSRSFTETLNPTAKNVALPAGDYTLRASLPLPRSSPSRPAKSVMFRVR